MTHSACGEEGVTETSLRTLQAEWRRKLAASGFRDIERGGDALAHGGERAAAHYFLALSPTEREATAAYFRQAQAFVWTRQFRSLDSVTCGVWRLHARGMPIAKIATLVRLGEKPVRRTIRRVRVMAGLSETTLFRADGVGHGNYRGEPKK